MNSRLRSFICSRLQIVARSRLWRLRRFKIPDLRTFATSELRRFKIPDLQTFATLRLRRFKIPDLRTFATLMLRRFKIPDLRDFFVPENSLHEFYISRRFEGDRFS
jgi:ferredoxin-fold anticodon binding domain-containing protein